MQRIVNECLAPVSDSLVSRLEEPVWIIGIVVGDDRLFRQTLQAASRRVERLTSGDAVAQRGAFSTCAASTLHF